MFEIAGVPLRLVPYGEGRTAFELARLLTRAVRQTPPGFKDAFPAVPRRYRGWFSSWMSVRQNLDAMKESARSARAEGAFFFAGTLEDRNGRIVGVVSMQAKALPENCRQLYPGVGKSVLFAVWLIDRKYRAGLTNQLPNVLKLCEAAMTGLGFVGHAWTLVHFSNMHVHKTLRASKALGGFDSDLGSLGDYKCVDGSSQQRRVFVSNHTIPSGA